MPPSTKDKITARFATIAIRVKGKAVLIILIVLAALIRILLIFRDSVPFAYDMGRDLLWAKDISFYYTPTLIGPAASIWGVYFQPFWYYFLSIPLLLTRGNPLSAVYATAAMVLVTGFLAFILFKKYFPKIYIFTLAVLLLFSNTLINISTFAFHANLLPLLTLLTTYFLFLSAIKNPQYFALAALTVGFMFSADPAPAVVFTLVILFMFFYLKIYRSAKAIILAIAAYVLPHIPQLLFELRNNFVETRSLASYFQGNNPSLSGQLPLLERIPNRLSIYFQSLKTDLAPNTVFAVALVILIVFGIYRFQKTNKNKNLSILFKINFYILVLSFSINTFLITVEIKNWYLFGVIVNFALLITFALMGIKSKLITFVFLTVFLVVNLLPFASNKKITDAKNDPAQFSNQLAVLDYIYSDAQSPFSVYVYTPSVYDHNYQYLFWWWGIIRKKGLPSDFAYLPAQPPYVRNKSKYTAFPQKAETIYLVIENARENQFYTSTDWQTNFNDYKIVWEKNINGAIKLEKRIK